MAYRYIEHPLASCTSIVTSCQWAIRRLTNTYDYYIYTKIQYKDNTYIHIYNMSSIPDIPDSRIELRLNWWRPLVLAATTQGAHLMSLLPPLAILCNTNCLASYLLKTLQYQLMPPLSILCNINCLASYLVKTLQYQLMPPLEILCNTNCLASYLVKTLQYQLMPPLSIPSILPQYSPMLSNTGIAIL